MIVNVFFCKYKNNLKDKIAFIKIFVTTSLQYKGRLRFVQKALKSLKRFLC